jgi:hypothetical protein
MRVSLALIAVLVGTLPRAGAVIVDRVAVAVGNKVITQSEIDQRIRLTAFQNHQKADFSVASRRQAAERLVDQRLVEREMDVGHYPRTAAARGDQLLADYIEENYKSDRAALDAALAGYEITERDLEDDLVRQTDLLTFLDLRFRPAVEVTERDIESFYNDKIAPGAAKTPQDIPAETRDEIEEQLTDERADKELNKWLQDQRRRTKILYADKNLLESDKNLAGTVSK